MSARTLDPLVPRFRSSWERAVPGLVATWRRLVDVNSHADNVAGIDAERALLRPELEALGLEVEEPAGEPSAAPRPRGAHLVARRAAPGARRLLLIGHLDTVFPPGDAFAGFREEGGIVRGPGVGDIKGGVVAMLGALAALRDADALDAADVTIVLNSDEEVGSQSSRTLLRELASSCDLALGFEPAFCPPGDPMGAATRIQHVIRRKGCGRFTVSLQGVAAHSGGAHHLGASAIEALARKVVAVHGLTDAARGVTTNVGLVHGGRSVNTVSPDACAEVDFRFQTTADGERAADELRAILGRDEDVNPSLGRAVTARIADGGGVLWPPLEPTPRSLALSRVVTDVTRSCGREAEAIARGGSSDAAHAAAVGVPAVCGLGPVSSGIHTDAEQSSIPALGDAVVIAAALLVALGDRSLEI